MTHKKLTRLDQPVYDALWSIRPCSVRGLGATFCLPPSPAMWSGFLLLTVALAAAPPGSAADPDGVAAAAKIDEIVAAYWAKHRIKTADLADDEAFLRRLSLDLLGRPPTPGERAAFVRDAAPEKRTRLIATLIKTPEFFEQLAETLDAGIQTRHAGDPEFVAWLREALRAGRSWDALFQQLLVGPWDAPADQPAARYLLKRGNSLDDMTRDTASVFFGVDISCARCHDHPLVEDWKQEHFYGLAAFFGRTTASKGKTAVLESDSGEVTYTAHSSGEKRTAAPMFLSGRAVSEPNWTRDPRLLERRAAAKATGKPVEPLASRRRDLVDAALAEPTFFRRAIVNRLWCELTGYGLVTPLDQMHSANPPCVPGLLEWLADDFAAHGYRLDRLVAAICGSRVYQAATVWPHPETRPHPENFAVANLRALAPRVYAWSLLASVGAAPEDGPRVDAAPRREAQQAAIKNLAAAMDPAGPDFEASAGEALYLTNHLAVQALFQPAQGNLAARLAEISDDGEVVDRAVRGLFHRQPRSDERQTLAAWLGTQRERRPQAISHLLWSLGTSAEFRFNH